MYVDERNWLPDVGNHYWDRTPTRKLFFKWDQLVSRKRSSPAAVEMLVDFERHKIRDRVDAELRICIVGHYFGHRQEMSMSGEDYVRPHILTLAEQHYDRTIGDLEQAGFNFEMGDCKLRSHGKQLLIEQFNGGFQYCPYSKWMPTQQVVRYLATTPKQPAWYAYDGRAKYPYAFFMSQQDRVAFQQMQRALVRAESDEEFADRNGRSSRIGFVLH